MGKRVKTNHGSEKYCVCVNGKEGGNEPTLERRMLCVCVNGLVGRDLSASEGFSVVVASSSFLAWFPVWGLEGGLPGTLYSVPLW